MRSEAKTVHEYIAGLPTERAEAISVVRQVILENLPDGFVETMNWGMITYEVPLDRYPDTYNKKPLMLAALGSQKNHMAVYLTAIYASDQLRKEFETAYQETGLRYDVGKSCVRFRNLDDLPLDLIGNMIAAVSVPEFIEQYQQSRPSRRR